MKWIKAFFGGFLKSSAERKKDIEYTQAMMVIANISGFVIIAYYSHFMVAVGCLGMIAGFEYELRAERLKREKDTDGKA